MSQEPKRRRIGLRSLIGWLIFFLVIANGPLNGLLRAVFGPGAPSALPLVIAGLVIVSVVLSLVGGLRRSGDQGPLAGGPPIRPSDSTPLSGPMVVGPARQPLMPPEARSPTAPRFEPLISPVLLLIGFLGLIGLGLLLIALTSQGLL